MEPERELDQLREQLRALHADRQAQQETIARFEQTLNRVSDAVFALDTDWRFTYLNPQAEVLLRRPAHELLGRSAWEAYPDAIGSISDEQFHRAMAEQRPVTFEAFYEPLQARFAVRAYPSPEGLTVIFQDITERERAEEALRESEIRYRNIVFFSPDAIFLARKNRIVFANQATLQLFGFASTLELHNIPLLDLFRPEFRSSLNERIAILEANGSVPTKEDQILRADGTVRDVETTASLTTHRGGKTVQFILRDITERKRAEEALRESEALLQRALSAPTVGVLFFKLNGAIRRVNATFERMSGYSADELIHMEHWLELTAPEFWDLTRRTAAEMAARGEVAPYEKQMVRKDGSRWWGLFAPTRLSGSGWESECVEFIIDITKRKQAEEALRESETLFRSLAENANAIVGIVQGTRFVYANAYFTQLSGYSRDELLTMEISRVIAPQHLAIVMERARLRQAGDRSLPARYEFAIVTKDDQEVWLDFAAALTEYQGKPAIIGIAYDITERKQAEEALRESEARYHAFSEASTEGIAIHEHGIILEVNRIIAEHLGYAPEEMVGQSLFNFLAPESMEEVIRHMQAGDSGPYFAVSLHRDGSKTIGEMRARNFIYHGRPVRMVAMRDVTMQKKLEQEREQLLNEVQRWAAELDATINAIPDGYIVYGADGAILRMNDMAQRILGFSEAERALPYAERMATLHAETLDGRPFPIEQLPSYRALHGETVRNALMVIHRPHQTYWLSVSASPIVMSDGQQFGAVMEFTDVTEQHSLQEQQRALLQMVSHDLRVPLSIIKGHAQVLEDLVAAAQIDGAIMGGLKAMDRATERMNTMIQDMVDATRFEGGQLVLKREPVALAPYLVDLLQRAATAIDVSRITLEVPAELPPVFADYARLERIFINLLSNALKYSPADRPVIVRAQQVDGQVEVSVQDFGQGIAPEDLPHLFERFYRAKGARKTEGVGLGLYITRTLVEAHGGEIRVESEPGKGSTFYFTLGEEP